VLGFGALVGLIYSPKALDAELLNHMQFSVNKKKKRGKRQSFIADESIKFDKKGFLSLIKALSNRMKFEPSDYLLILSQFLPSRCRSSDTNRHLIHVNRGLDRTHQSLDIKRILEMDQDVQFLMRRLLGPRKTWLLHR
jgi:hypothetical protein